MNRRNLSVLALFFLICAASCRKDEERDKFDAGGVPVANPSPSQAPYPSDTIALDTAVRPDPTHGQVDTLAAGRTVAADSGQ